VLHQFFVYDKTSNAASHAFAGFSIMERNEWMEKIEKVMRGEFKVTVSGDSVGGASEVDGQNAGTGFVEMEGGKGAVELGGQRHLSEMPALK
jgi:hypothetical protein